MERRIKKERENEAKASLPLFSILLQEHRIRIAEKIIRRG